MFEDFTKFLINVDNCEENFQTLFIPITKKLYTEFKETDFIIHLAGAGIADKRWTKSRKKQLIASRVDSTNLLFEKVKELNPNLKGFISASGIGFYGAITSNKIFQENDAPYNDFLSEICILWEKEVYKFTMSYQINNVPIAAHISGISSALSLEGYDPQLIYTVKKTQKENIYKISIDLVIFIYSIIPIQFIIKFIDLFLGRVFSREY